MYQVRGLEPSAFLEAITKEPQYFILKQDGKKLTGSGGPDAVEQYPILNGSVENDVVTFGLTMTFGLTTGEWTFKYDLRALARNFGFCWFARYTF